MTSNYQKFYKRSIESKEEFWREQSELVDWETKFSKVFKKLLKTFFIESNFKFSENAQNFVYHLKRFLSEGRWRSKFKSQNYTSEKFDQFQI